MLFADLVVAVMVALLIGCVFAALGRPGPWPGLVWFFLLLVTFTWAGGVWLGPYGPPLWGIYWAPFVTFALLGALLVAATSPPRRRPTPEPDLSPEGHAAGAAAAIAIDAFFWLVLIALLVAILLHYVLPG